MNNKFCAKNKFPINDNSFLESAKKRCLKKSPPVSRTAFILLSKGFIHAVIAKLQREAGAQDTDKA